MQMQPITPDQQITVTMTITQWRMVLEKLSQPLIPVQQLIGDIEQQCHQHIMRLQTQMKTTEEMATDVSDQDNR